MVLKLKKTWLGFDTVNFFGFKVTKGTISMTDDRVKQIQSLPFPTNQKMAQHVMGVLQFIARLIPDYHQFSGILSELTTAGFDWDKTKWVKDYEGTFRACKESALNSRVIFLPDYKLDWFLTVDASDLGCGSTLLQVFVDEQGEKIEQPLNFSAMKWSKEQAKCSTNDKEFMGVVSGVKSNQFQLMGKFFVLRTDHRTLQWMVHQAQDYAWRAVSPNVSFLYPAYPWYFQADDRP
jgi:hypothetical protein